MELLKCAKGSFDDGRCCRWMRGIIPIEISDLLMMAAQVVSDPT
jgi:hypothetical protein